MIDMAPKIREDKMNYLGNDALGISSHVKTVLQGESHTSCPHLDSLAAFTT